MARVHPAGTTLLLCSLLAPLPAAADITLSKDGWHRWEVAAAAGGRDACCHEFRNLRLTGAVGCQLGRGENDFAATGHCDVSSSSMVIYVETRDGHVREIRALSRACPVRVAGELHTLGPVSTAQSIAWLMQQATDHPALAGEAIMAISFHEETQALQALISLIEDGRQRRDAREQALFWLVQSESDRAFAYLDRLLD